MERLLSEPKARDRRTLAQEYGIVLSEREFVVSPFNSLDLNNSAHAVTNGEQVAGVKRGMYERAVRTIGSLGQGAAVKP